jgi:hypothetical protein
MVVFLINSRNPAISGRPPDARVRRKGAIHGIRCEAMRDWDASPSGGLGAFPGNRFPVRTGSASTAGDLIDSHRAKRLIDVEAPCLRRSRAVSAAERTVEMRQVREAGVKRNRGDRAALQVRIGQKSMGKIKTPRQDEFRDGPAFALKKLMDIPGRNAVASRDRGDRHVSFGQPALDVRFNGMQARRSNAGGRPDFAVPIGAEA